MGISLSLFSFSMCAATLIQKGSDSSFLHLNIFSVIYLVSSNFLMVDYLYLTCESNFFGVLFSISVTRG